jgi:arylsulfatase A-like enzyme
MKHSFQITALLLGVVFSLHGAEPTAKRPNILLIYSDDHGWADLGVQAVDQNIRTPNLDQLARDGVRFSRGYVTAPQCVPSRAGLLTGRYQQRFGLEDNNKGPLALNEQTIAERLKPAGYLSGQVGKWHLDLVEQKDRKGPRSELGFMPHAQGFQEYWRGDMRQYVASHDLQGKPFADAPHRVVDDRFRITVQTEAALSFLDRRASNAEQPWFLYLAWFAPHVPLESPEPWFSQTPENLPKERRQALAMIAAMDDGLGKLRAKLEALGMASNTLILFIGDNGAPLKKGAWDGSINAPLIGEKGMLTDGGIRTPFIATWPNKFPKGKVYDHPVSSLDVAATALAAAGLQHDDRLDGVNLVPFLCDEKTAAPHETLFWRWRTQAAVLEFPWKLIRLGANDRYLFDVTEPTGETYNLLEKHPEIAERLDAKLQKWSQTLQPPGLPTESVKQDQIFFEDHGLLPKQDATTTDAAAGTMQDWLCRNGTLALRQEALAIIADKKKAGTFITCNTLNIPGPITATLRLRAEKGSPAHLTWRCVGQPDFLAENKASFSWPTSKEWQEVKLTLPITTSLIHLRIQAGHEADGLEIQSIELIGNESKTKRWSFDSMKKP